MSTSTSLPLTDYTGTASAPFNQLNADVTIRSKDGIDFQVYAAIVSMASPVFQVMFEDVKDKGEVLSAAGLPLICLQEDAQTLDSLLRLLYPVINPEPEFEDVHAILKAARKYEMEKAELAMRKVLVDFAPHYPLQVFAIACRYDYELEARAAADHAAEELEVYVDDLEDISAGAYYRLLEFHRAGKPPACVFCHPHSLPTTPPPSAIATVTISPIFNFSNADIILRSLDNIDFYVHKVILFLGSNIGERLDMESPMITHEGIPVIEIPEPSTVIDKLLQVCYPMDEPDIDGMHAAYALLEAAVTYCAPKAILLAKRELVGSVTSNPLMVYCAAARYGWRKESLIAAIECAQQRQEALYIPEMEHLSARAYFRLVRYCRRRRDVFEKLGYPLRQDTSSFDSQLKTMNSELEIWRENPSKYTIVAISVLQDALKKATGVCRGVCHQRNVGCLECRERAEPKGVEAMADTQRKEEAVMRTLSQLQLE